MTNTTTDARRLADYLDGADWFHADNPDTGAAKEAAAVIRALADQLDAAEAQINAMLCVSAAMLWWAQNGQPYLRPPFLETLLAQYAETG